MGYFQEGVLIFTDVAGALDINWASLVRDTPATHEVAAGTALKRFSPAHLLARIGVSTRYARKEVIEKVRAVCAADAAKDEGKFTRLIICLGSVSHKESMVIENV